MNTANVDPAEVRKFSEAAHRWWDPASEFKPLHEINPLRLGWINDRAPLAGKEVVDIGCGGGILSESMAALDARVTAIDMSEEALGVARLHLYESGHDIDYRHLSAEALAAEMPAHFDVVTCMEMLEHVPDPASVIEACATLVKPGGDVFLSTLNRNLKSYLLAIVGAEYLLNMLPRGTHEWARFITPGELGRHCRNSGLEVIDISGMSYNPLSKRYRLGSDTDVNYLVHCRRR